MSAIEPDRRIHRGPGRLDLRLVPVVLAAACGSGSSASDEAVRLDSAGVEIVANAGEDRALSWRLEPLWRIGGFEDERLGLAGLAAHEVAADRSGRVHVLDRADRRVHILSPEGGLVGTLGREGGGPGELESPMAIAIDGDESVVAVYDFAKGGLVRWSAEGEVLEGVDIDAMFWGPELEAANGSVIFATFEGRSGASTRLGLLSWSPEAEHTLARFTSAALHPADFPTCGQQGALVAPLFAPELVWDAAGDRVAVNTRASYVIDVYEANRLARSIRRAVSPREVTDEMGLRQVGDGLYFGAVDCTIPPAEAVRGHGYADVLPGLTALALAPAGDVWALRGRVEGEPNRIDVFGSDGSYIGTLPPGAPFPAAFLPGDRIVAVETDSFDVPVIVAYQVDRSP